MSIIKKLSAEEIPEFVKIVVNAYAGMMQNSPDFMERYTQQLIEIQENEDLIDFYGLFRDGKLLGGMRLNSFRMNLFSKMIDVGGVGLVAVDLLHKKEKVAKELIEYFTNHFQQKQSSIALLYPFRPDFYYKMGFGYGTKMNQYSILPSSFPNNTSKEGLIYLDSSHKELIKECHDNYARAHHGMILKTNHQLENMFKNQEHKLIGYVNNGVLESYMMFILNKQSDNNFLIHNIEVKELIYHNPRALAKICTFVNSQADQAQRVILNTPDPNLEFLVGDARNGTNRLIPSVYHETNTSGTGLMYRIIDFHQFVNELKGVNFNQVSCNFKLKITDTFLMNTEVKIALNKGYISIFEDSDVDFEVELNISDASSLFMGVIDAMSLYQYGRLRINKIEYIETLEKMFRATTKPICFTKF